MNVRLVHKSKLKVTVGASLHIIYNAKKTMNMGNGIPRWNHAVMEVSKKWNKNFMNDFTNKITKDLITSTYKIRSTFSSVIKTVRMAAHDDLGLKTYSRMPRNL